MDKLDPNDPRAPYLQVADLFRRAINEGHYQPGDKLPGFDQVSGRYGVARGTVRRAFERLQAENLITIRHGQGSFVRPRPEEPDAKDGLESVNARLADLAARVERIEQRLAGR